MLKRRLGKIKKNFSKTFNQFVAWTFIVTQLAFPIVSFAPAQAGHLPDFPDTQDPGETNNESYWCDRYLDSDDSVKFDNPSIDQTKEDIKADFSSDELEVDVTSNNSNKTIVLVVVKAGSDGGDDGHGNEVYSSAPFENLTAPDNKEISHVIVCYDKVENGDIKVKKLNDLNGDGNKDDLDGEHYLSDWTIRLYDTSWVLKDEIETSSTDWVKFSNLPLGTYYLCEVLVPGWQQIVPDSNDVGNQSGAVDEAENCFSVTLTRDGQQLQRTFANQQIPDGTLIVKKIVINDDGGTKNADDFSFKVNDGPATSFVLDGSNDKGKNTLVLPANVNYEVTEPEVNGYETSYDNCSVHLSAGETEICTITNNDMAPKLTLKKIVINDDGGENYADDWTLRAKDGDNYLINEAGSPADQLVAVTQTTTAEAGIAYELSETGPDGYTASNWTCYGGSGNELQGDIVTLELGENVTCKITNDDEAAKLKVVKVVDNNWGGTLEASDFPLYVGDLEVESGENNYFDAGWYIISEIQQDGYELDDIYGDCEWYEGQIAIKLEVGQSYVCYLENDDKPGSITVYKKVINDDGGKLDYDDFELFVDNQQVNHGQQNQLPVGEYTIGENHQQGYELKSIKCYVKFDRSATVEDLLYGDENGWERIDSEDNDQAKVWLDLDEHIVCVVKNDDIPPKIIVKKFTLDGDHNKFSSDEKFKFEVKNKDYPQEEYNFWLDTNPWTQNIDNKKEIELEQAGLFLIKEAREPNWVTYVKCFNRGAYDQLFSQDSLAGDFMNQYGFSEREDSSIAEWVDVGETLVCIFLNIEKGEVDVVKYHDLNQNGKFDEGEPKLSDWEFYLDRCYSYDTFETGLYDSDYCKPIVPEQNGYECNGHTYCDSTNEKGKAEFEGLKPFRLYKLSEELQDGWVQGNIECDYYSGYGDEPNGVGSYNGYNDYTIYIKPGSKVKCYVGNFQKADLLIEKSNDSTDALLPGQTANFMITVTNPAEDSGILENVQVYDQLPDGLSYVSGSAEIDGSSAIPEPDYGGSGPAIWSLGTMNPGDTKILSYTVIVDDDTPPGTYTNVAWTIGEQCVEYSTHERECEEFEDVLGNDHLEDPFVTSSVTVAAVEGSSTTTGAVLSDTGTPVIMPVLTGLTVAVVGVAVLVPRKKWKDLLSRISSSTRALLILAVMLLALASPARVLAVSGFWKLTAADLANSTSSSSLSLSYSVTSTNNSSSTDVTLNVDGPGSNDYNSGPVNISGSESQTFALNMPVDGTYNVTVSAVNNTGESATSPTSIGQTIVRDSVEPAAATVNNVTQQGNQWTITFTVPEGSDAQSVVIYSSNSSNFTADESTKVAVITPTPGEQQTFVFNASDDGQRFFAIQTRDSSGNVSTLVSGPGTQAGESALLADASNDEGVVSAVAATDDQTANNNEGQQQAATDEPVKEEQDNSSNVILTVIILGLAAAAGYYFLRRDPSES